MPSAAQLETLVRFFKVLAEPNRLRIVGLLAERPRAVDEIAAALRVGKSTASHHLAKLEEASLVSARAQGYYSIYSLLPETLTSMAKSLLQHEELPRLAGKRGGDVFEQKVLSTFLTREGRIKSFPAQEKKYLVLLRHVLEEFRVGVKYSEKQVNLILKKYNEDSARLRRSLVDHGFMAREGGGGKYWRL